MEGADYKDLVPCTFHRVTIKVRKRVNHSNGGQGDRAPSDGKTFILIEVLQPLEEHDDETMQKLRLD